MTKFDTILKAILIAVAISTFFYFDSREPETIEVSYRVHTGDTLWHVLGNRISDRYDIREYIYYISEKNGIKNGRLEPGKEIILVLPKED